MYYTYSTDSGRSWADPVRVDTGANTDIWPWIAVGDPGRVAIAWLQADKKLPNHDPETAGEHGWRVTTPIPAAAEWCRCLGSSGRPVGRGWSTAARW